MIQLSDTFQLYETQYLSKCQQLQNLTISPLHSLPKPQYHSTSNLLQQCLILQKQIDLELCSLPSSQKQLLQTKYKPFRKMISKKKQQFSQVPQPLEVDHAEQTDNFESQNDKLLESKKLLYEVSDMSDNIVGELRVQTGKMEGQKKKLEEVRDLLGKGEKIIGRLWIKQKKYKIVMVFLAVVLGLIFLWRLI